ncbi:MAG TPA: RNA methyltransferase [Terriglobales bacterium]|nr:RNA methyltransferase [Terriglobales bacterium]
MKKTSKTTDVDGRLRRIEGRHNSLAKELRKAFAHGEKTEDGYTAIEGIRILEEALRSGLRFQAVFFSNSGKNKAVRLVPQISAHVETLLLPDKLFASVVSSETPQGVAALVRVREFSLAEVLARKENGPLIVIAGLQDPGNLGTILRSAEAFGAGGVILGEGTVHHLNSKVVRASAGSVFRLPIATGKLNETIQGMRHNKVRMLATSSHKGISLRDANLGVPLAIFIGSEGAGVPRDLIRDMDEFIAIPHSTQVESLNAGVAASIVLYEAARQK